MRKLCSHCHYPMKTCVCHAVGSIDTDKELVVIQHYKESSHAKNTVRLARLCLPNLRVYPVRTDDDIFEVAKRFRNRRCAVFFPDDQSRTLEREKAEFRNNSYDALLFVDGSWKQSKGIFKRLTSAMPCDIWQLSNEHVAQYRIRHTKLNGAFSTLEAMALSLELGLDLDPSPLLNVFEAFQQHWQGPQNPRD